MPRFARWSSSWILLIIGCLMMPMAVGAAPNAVIPTPTSTPPLPTSTPTPLPTSTPTPLPTATPTPVEPTRTPRTPEPAPEPSATPVPTADPRVIKSVDPASGHPGDTIRFSIVVHNDAAIPFTNIVIEDTVPDAFQITSATVTQGTVTVTEQRVQATIGTIEPGQEVTLVITTIIRPNAVPGLVENVALLTTDTPGDDPSNNTSRVTVTILGPPAQPSPTTGPLANVPPTKLPPVKLPPTGDGGPSNEWLALPALAALLAGILLRRRRAKGA